MRKLNLFSLSLLFLLAACGQEEMEKEVKRPVIPSKQSSVTITGDSIIASTRAAGGRVEFAGGYATGAGLYDGIDKATVAAVPYTGYQLVSFTGGPVDGDPNRFSGRNEYVFDIERRDWKFSVTFKKEYSISVVAGSGGTVTGGGVAVEGSSYTVSAAANSGYSFDGWYEGSTKVSNSASYTFTVSSNRTGTIY